MRQSEASHFVRQIDDARSLIVRRGLSDQSWMRRCAGSVMDGTSRGEARPHIMRRCLT